MSLIKRIQDLEDNDQRVIIAQKRAQAELRAMSDRVTEATNDFNTQLSKFGNEYSLSALIIARDNQNRLFKQYQEMKELFGKEFSGAPVLKLEAVSI